MRLTHRLRTQFAFLAAGATLTITSASAPADLMELNFSGTYTTASVYRPSWDSSENNGSILPVGGNRPTVPVGLLGSSFSGTLYFDPTTLTEAAGSVVATYTGTPTGVTTTSYINDNQQIQTQSTLTFNMLNYQLSDRNANNSTQTIKVENFGQTITMSQNAYNGFDFIDNTESYANAPILPNSLLGLPTGLVVQETNGAYDTNGNYYPPDTTGYPSPTTPAFYIANSLDLTFRGDNPMSTGLSLPTAGPIDLSEFTDATISFTSADNVTMYDYQDFVNIVGTITSASISEVPEPSTGMQCALVFGALTLGAGAFRRRNKFTKMN